MAVFIFGDGMRRKYMILSFYCDRMYVFGVICHPSFVFYIIVGEFFFYFVDKNKPQVPDSCQDKVWEI